MLVRIVKNETMLTVASLARELNVSTRTIRNWMRDGSGPEHFRLGSAIRFRRTDVESWLQSKREDR